MPSAPSRKERSSWAKWKPAVVRGSSIRTDVKVGGTQDVLNSTWRQVAGMGRATSGVAAGAVGLQKGPGEPRSSDCITGESIKAVLFLQGSKQVACYKDQRFKNLLASF